MAGLTEILKYTSAPRLHIIINIMSIIIDQRIVFSWSIYERRQTILLYNNENRICNPPKLRTADKYLKNNNILLMVKKNKIKYIYNFVEMFSIWKNKNTNRRQRVIVIFDLLNTITLLKY